MSATFRCIFRSVEFRVSKRFVHVMIWLNSLEASFISSNFLNIPKFEISNFWNLLLLKRLKQYLNPWCFRGECTCRLSFHIYWFWSSQRCQGFRRCRSPQRYRSRLRYWSHLQPFTFAAAPSPEFDPPPIFFPHLRSLVLAGLDSVALKSRSNMLKALHWHTELNL